MIKSKFYTIKGAVQGVGFRYFVYSKAKAFDIKGYVENMDDGSVVVIAEGEENNLSSFEGYLYEGSDFSRIDSIEFNEIPTRGYKNFEVV